MDPGRAISDLRRWARGILEEADSSSSVDQELASFAQQFLDLDRWMSQGGFLPSVWQHGRSLGSQANAHSPQNLPQPGHDSQGGTDDQAKLRYNWARDHEINHELITSLRNKQKAR